jgi:hypothetical protein
VSVKEVWVDIHYDYGSVGFVNRPVRTRMRGIVGASSKLPFTRLGPTVLDVEPELTLA